MKFGEQEHTRTSPIKILSLLGSKSVKEKDLVKRREEKQSQEKGRKGEGGRVSH